MSTLSPRLAALAALVRKHALLVDVGSDHGYLPLFLLREGAVERAVATDLREGPLACARAHLAAEHPSLSARLGLLRTDGLTGLDGYILPHIRDGASDIAIAGMGGELIVSILEKALWVRHPAVRLLLQPMTKPEAVRRFLQENGFFTEKELLVREGDRIYQILAAGTPFGEAKRSPPLTALEALTGRREFWGGEDGTPDPLRLALFEKLKQRTQTALAGKRKANLPPEALAPEETLLRELDAALAAMKTPAEKSQCERSLP